MTPSVMRFEGAGASARPSAREEMIVGAATAAAVSARNLRRLSGAGEGDSFMVPRRIRWWRHRVEGGKSGQKKRRDTHALQTLRDCCGANNLAKPLEYCVFHRFDFLQSLLIRKLLPNSRSVQNFSVLSSIFCLLSSICVLSSISYLLSPISYLPSEPRQNLV